MLIRCEPEVSNPSYSTIYGITDFKASTGWWDKVRKRNGIGKSIRLHGEAGDVNEDEVKEKIDEITKDLEGYDPENIYNWDETSLYFKLLPSATYTARKMLGMMVISPNGGSKMFFFLK